MVLSAVLIGCPIVVTLKYAHAIHAKDSDHISDQGWKFMMRHINLALVECILRHHKIETGSIPR